MILSSGVHNTWELHLESRGDPLLEGTWNNITEWKVYEYDQEVPHTLPMRTAMCVPVCSLDPHNPQVMLTLNLGRGGYEIPGGHRDPLKGGGTEPPRWAAVREVREETGLRLRFRRLVPFAYTEVNNDPNPPGYMQFFSVHARNGPGRITDPEVDGAGIFTLDALHTMVERGAMKITELKIVCSGVRALLRHYGLPDEYITMP